MRHSNVYIREQIMGINNIMHSLVQNNQVSVILSLFEPSNIFSRDPESTTPVSSTLLTPRCRGAAPEDGKKTFFYTRPIPKESVLQIPFQTGAAYSSMTVQV